MGTMRYKPLDRVKIKSLDWYNENKNKRGNISFPYEVEVVFTPEMSSFCGQIVTISKIGYTQGIGFYRIRENNGVHKWTDEMIEGLIEPIDCKKCGLTRMSTRCLFMDNCPHNQPKNTIEIPKGWICKDENGNVINATKIVLEKKKEYPKTYEECCKVMNYCCNPVATKTTHKEELIRRFQFLLLYRDAYWKLYGEETGLGKPWEPGDNKVFGIIRQHGKIQKYNDFVGGSTILEFPTEEMRDDFKENFDPDIEFCKELL